MASKNWASVVTGLGAMIGGTVVIALIVSGGGLVLPFLKVHWAVWAILLFILILFISKR